jgi:hypothetical protein
MGRVRVECDCGARLSIHNDGYYCALHEQSVVRVRGKKIA